MQTKKMGYFLSTLLLLSGLICSVNASTTTVSFRGGGVTINLTFPEEAHPTESIWHNVTITAISPTTQLRNFTAVIKAPVNSSWVEIFNSQDTFSKPLPVSYNLTLSLPQGTNGTLYCFMYVNTSSIDDLSTTFYTTQVREMTYSELLEGYNVLNDTYNQLVADYDDLNNTYNDLQSSYAALNSSYNELIEEYNLLNDTYNQLVADYDDLNNTYNDLQSSYAALNSSYNELSGNYSILNNSYNALLDQYATLDNNYNELDSNYNNVNSARNLLLGDYSKLQSDYDSLNSTFYSVQGNYTDLQAVYDALNQTYNDLLTDLNDLQRRFSASESAMNTDKIVMFIFLVAVACLIAFIIYIKRKEREPYVVIRKETVAVKPDEKS